MWSTGLRGAFSELGGGLVGFIPEIVVALVIFVVGWFIGSLLGQVVSQIFRTLKVDNLLKSAKVDEVLKRGGFSLDSGRFVGSLVEWFVVLVFLVASLDVLGLSQVNEFLRDVVLQYLPKVIIAVLILLVAVVIAAAMQRIVVGSAMAAGVKSANFLGAVTRWSIWIFAILGALLQLDVAVVLIQSLFQGFVVALSLAIGLSFGLGGQQAASEIIDKVRGEIKSHQK